MNACLMIINVLMVGFTAAACIIYFLHAKRVRGGRKFEPGWYDRSSLVIGHPRSSRICIRIAIVCCMLNLALVVYCIISGTY